MSTHPELWLEVKTELPPPILPEVLPKARGACLIFPPCRFAVRMKKLRLAKRFGLGASVFMAAVMQYLVMEVLDMSNHACRHHHKRLIIPRHIQVAFQGDEDLNKLVHSLLLLELPMPRIQAMVLQRRRNR
jgi:histone H2A